jgi:positive regulator of sigma E activity
MKSKFYLVLAALAGYVTYLLILWLIRWLMGSLPVYRDLDFILAFVVIGFIILAQVWRKRKEKKNE